MRLPYGHSRLRVQPWSSLHLGEVGRRSFMGGSNVHASENSNHTPRTVYPRHEIVV